MLLFLRQNLTMTDLELTEIPSLYLPVLVLKVCAPVPGCVLFKFACSVCHLKLLVYHLHRLQLLEHTDTLLSTHDFTLTDWTKCQLKYSWRKVCTRTAHK